MFSIFRFRQIQIIAALACFFSLDHFAEAQVPQIISYQGQITVNSVNFDGTGQFKFVLINSATGQTLWSNDGTSTNGSEPNKAVGLNVESGSYTVLLGDTSIANMVPVPTSVFGNSGVRLRIWFNDGTHGSQQLVPDQKIPAAGYAMMADEVTDGAITSAKIANGAVGANQLGTGAAAANLTATTGNPLNTFALGAPTLFPDLDDTAWVGSTGAKLTIQGTLHDKPSFAVVGDYRNGSNGERYATVITANGGILSNSWISLEGAKGISDVATMFTIEADVPVAMSLYTPYNPASDGTLISGWGIPTSSGAASRVFHVNSQGTVRLVNPYGNSYPMPQMILRATDAGNPNHNDFAIQTLNGETLFGSWNESVGDFKNTSPYTGIGEIRIRPGDVDIVANVFKTYGGIQIGDGLTNPGANNIAIAGLVAGQMVYADNNKKLVSTGYSPANIVRKDQAPKFSVSTSNGQAISKNSATKLRWDSEGFDTNSNFASDRFTPKTAGKYLLNTSVTIANGNVGTQIRVSVYKNGSELARIGTQYVAANNAEVTVGGNVIVDANGTTDYFEVYLFHDNGTPLSTSAGSVLTYFQGALLP